MYIYIHIYIFFHVCIYTIYIHKKIQKPMYWIIGKNDNFMNIYGLLCAAIWKLLRLLNGNFVSGTYMKEALYGIFCYDNKKGLILNSCMNHVKMTSYEAGKYHTMRDINEYKRSQFFKSIIFFLMQKKTEKKHIADTILNTVYYFHISNNQADGLTIKVKNIMDESLK